LGKLALQMRSLLAHLLGKETLEAVDVRPKLAYVHLRDGLAQCALVLRSWWTTAPFRLLSHEESPA
jgi:hypothetical protein